jgi:ADP-ribose pyrophosphatase
MTVRLALALEWVKTGRITDAKTVSGILWADKFL